MSYPLTPTLSVDAVQVSLTWPVTGSVKARLPGAVGGCVSPADGPYTSNSLICPAGQPVFAVMVSRTYRAVAAPKVTVTTLPAAGSNTYPVPVTMVARLVPSVLPWIDSVCVRTPHDGGSLSTSWSTAVAVPRSTWTHCGNALFVPSQ